MNSLCPLLPFRIDAKHCTIQTQMVEDAITKRLCQDALSCTITTCQKPQGTRIGKAYLGPTHCSAAFFSNLHSIFSNLQCEWSRHDTPPPCRISQTILSYLGATVILQRCKGSVCGENVDNTACANSRKKRKP